MDRRMRHRTTVYSRNIRGELVELRTRNASSPEEAIAAAIAAARRRPLGAVAYTVELDADGWEVEPAQVLGRWGNLPDAQPLPV